MSSTPRDLSEELRLIDEFLDPEFGVVGFRHAVLGDGKKWSALCFAEECTTFTVFREQCESSGENQTARCLHGIAAMIRMIKWQNRLLRDYEHLCKCEGGERKQKAPRYR